MKPDIRVTLKALLPTPQGVGVFLADGLKVIAVFVDPFVAAAITMFAQEMKKPRPLTHDLVASILSGLGARITKVVINDLQGDTFFARIYLLQENEMGRSVVEIDARPSDSIALAIQQKCPIYVAARVWDRAEDASWALRQARDASENGDPSEGESRGMEFGE